MRARPASGFGRVRAPGDAATGPVTPTGKTFSAAVRGRWDTGIRVGPPIAATSYFQERGIDVTEQNIRICSTKSALSEMLETASRKLERTLRITKTAPGGETASGLDQARSTVADLEARLATHRSIDGC